MKKLGSIFLLFICVGFVLVSCSADDDATNDPVDQTPLEAAAFLNVSYGDNPQQVYDIYLPAGRTSTNTKTIILVHGGGWTEGDKTDMDGFIDLIQANHPEHAVVNVNYVLANASLGIPAFPNQFLDLVTIVEKLTAEKEELQITSEFGMIGTSAGAHLSLMYDSVYDDNDQVKFVADIVGPTDFTDPFYQDNPLFPLALAAFVDESQYPDGTNYAEATSPVFNINGNTSPTAMFYGNQDPLVPLTNGNLLEEKLTDAQITNSYTIYDGGHGDWGAADYINLQTQISEYINDFLPID